jgi:pimeloyl-ACP methyl ester carboxylesterase
LRLILRGLSTLPTRDAVAALTTTERETLRALLGAMRSGRGFLNDLRPGPDLSSEVRQPTLVIASRNDRGVPFGHAESLVAGITGATLAESRAASHFVWFAPDWPAIAETVQRFMAVPTTPSTRPALPPMIFGTQ